MRSTTYVCGPCRTVAKSTTGPRRCPHCSAAMTDVGTRWRPPPRVDRTSWSKVADGQWLTERPRGVQGRRARHQAAAALLASTPAGLPGLPGGVGRSGRSRRTSEVARFADLLANSPEPGEVAGAARHPNAEVRMLVAQMVSGHVLELLLGDADPEVQAEAARNPALPADDRLRRRLLRADPIVRMALASRPDLSARLLTRLLKDTDPTVASVAARLPSAPLKHLARRPLGWLPEARLAEVAGEAAGPRLVLLRELHATSGAELTLADARDVLDTVLA